MSISVINCKKCQAPLDFIGNLQRNRFLVCQYCGTLMDTRLDFKALYTFASVQKGSAKYQIGKQINIKNHNFTITGFINYNSQEKDWINYQLYSKQHGYALLIDKDKQSLFLRKTHYLPSTNVWLMQKNNTFTLKQNTFKISNFYQTQLYYAAGNLTQNKIQANKRNKHCFAFSTENNKNNRKEYFYSIYHKNKIEYYLGFEV